MGKTTIYAIFIGAVAALFVGIYIHQVGAVSYEAKESTVTAAVESDGRDNFQKIADAWAEAQRIKKIEEEESFALYKQLDKQLKEECAAENQVRRAQIAMKKYTGEVENIDLLDCSSLD